MFGFIRMEHSNQKNTKELDLGTDSVENLWDCCTHNFVLELEVVMGQSRQN